MSRIRVTPEQLRSSSNVFKQGSSSTQSLISRLNNQVNQLTSTWEGAAHNAFFEKYQSLQPSLKQFVTVLDHISQQLTSVAQTMEETDREIASRMRN